MKFAVKTVTCLGCRTPLKSGKGELALEYHCRWRRADQAEFAVCVNCRSKLPDLYQKQVSLPTPANEGEADSSGRPDFFPPDRFCPTLDAMSAMSGIIASRCHLYFGRLSDFLSTYG
jgi:hypothetical protein